MKRKIVSIILICVIILGSFSLTFADLPIPMKLNDLEGTAFEIPVYRLIQYSVLAGYEDKTFRPLNTITRAEAASMLYNAHGAFEPYDTTLKERSNFYDLGGYDWALYAINYCAEKGLVSGYGDGEFRPANQITYAEFATMLVNACGRQDKVDSSKSWPDNYRAAIDELGLYDVISSTVYDYSIAPIVRGDAALMTHQVLFTIRGWDDMDINYEECVYIDENGEMVYLVEFPR